MKSRQASLPLLVLAALGGCTAGGVDTIDEALRPTFSPEGKFDGTEVSVRFLQDIGTNATVQGRFQRDLKYRGFTVEVEAGSELHVQLSAQREVGGFVQEGDVEAQLMLYGPVDGPADLFDDVIVDSGTAIAPELQHTVDEDGLYLVVATRPDSVQDAHFQLDVQCPTCQIPPEPKALCDSGRLFVEGATLKSQEWTRCEVVVLEPTRLPAEETLVIGPDVDVRAHYFITDFHPQGWGEVELTIDGQLVLESEPGHRVSFSSNVEGKQWRGIVVNRPDTHVHDFEISDSLRGIVVQASGVRLSDGEVFLNRRGVTLQGTVAGVEIEGVEFHDNEVGLTNRYADVVGTPDHRVATTDELFVLDSRFEVNGTGISLASLQGSFLDGLTLESNGVAMNIAGRQSVQTAFPEDWVAVSNCRVIDNDVGILLSGNGSVDGCLMRDNAKSAVQATMGWHKVKNSLVTANGRLCDTAAIGFPQTRDCGALYAASDAHTVFRNNVVEHNFGHGFVLEGTTVTNAVPRDPAVLNSKIADNAGYGVLLYNAPIVSIEFNDIEANARGALGLAWQSCGWTQALSRLHCRLNQHRIERNNFGDDATVAFRVPGRDDWKEIVMQGFTALDVSPNHWGDRDGDEVAAMFTGVPTMVLPTLDEREPTAGLLVPLPDFDE